MASPAVVAVICLLALACGRKSRTLTEAPAELLSVVDVADPRALVQLSSGFWKLEAGSWRWTAGRFLVVLRPPENAAARGAQLRLEFDLPQIILDQLGPMTLLAKVNGFALPPGTYSTAGPADYTRDVPPEALDSPAVAIEFSTDKAIQPSPDGDDRELALIARRIGFTTR